MTFKTILYKALMILLPVATLAAAFESLARKVPTSYSIKNDNLLAKAQKVEVLVLGSSHANFGINPQYMGDNVQNVANTSQDLYYDCKLLSKYLKYCPNVRVVVLPISYFSLYYSLCESPEKWRTDFYETILDIPKPILAESDPLDIRQYSHLLLLEGPSKVLGELRSDDKVQINEYGYQRPKSQLKDRDLKINHRAGKARVEFHHTIMHKKYLAPNIANIENIAAQLKSRKIRLVFVTTPVYKTYYENMSPRYYNEMVTSLSQLQRKYNARYLNYLADSRFQNEDFMDNDHLNENGAKKFSRILYNDIFNYNARNGLSTPAPGSLTGVLGTSKTAPKPL